MKILIQRVSKASVEVGKKEVGVIGHGALVFVGVKEEDTKEQALWLANKFVKLRMFNDEQDKPNLSILEVRGSALIISQFTLYADCFKGNRPSYVKAACPELAKALYEDFIAEVKKSGVPVQTGTFGARMRVSLVNEGPITLLIEK